MERWCHFIQGRSIELKEITDNIIFDEKKCAQVMRDDAQIQKISDKQKVLNYLSSFKPDCVAAGKVYDCVKGEFTDITIEGYEDGEYYWETTQIYYFDKYDIKLDDDFVRKVIAL